MKKSLLMRFTLVELLIVISIIAILTAILLPALSKAKESVRQITCTNRIKQLGTAMLLYTNDYDGRFAPSYGAMGDVDISAPKLLFEYLGVPCNTGYTEWNKVKHLHCPSSSRLSIEAISLGNNYYLCDSYKITQIKKSSLTVLFFDCSGLGHYGNKLDTVEVVSLAASRRHSNMANYGMLDNHVERLKREKILWCWGTAETAANNWKWYPGYQ